MFAAAGRDHRRGATHVPPVRLALEGHPDPALPWVDVATGSLGWGMPIAAAIALCARELDRLPIPGVGAVR